MAGKDKQKRVRLTSKLFENLPYLAGAVALALGIFCWLSVDYALEDMREVRPLMLASESWPKTKGVIVSQNIHEDISGRFSHTPVTHYIAELGYTFMVRDTLYSGARVCPEGGNCGLGMEKEDAQALLAQYPVGSIVQVAYAPRLEPWPEGEGAGVMALLRPGWRPWIDDVIAMHWRNAVLSGLLALALMVYVVRTAKEFRT